MANFAIFGCTGGIGLSITQKLLNQGHRIFGVARNLEKLDDLKSKNQNIITHSIENPNFDEIRIFSRDEKKQDDLRKKLKNSKVKFYIGDAVRYPWQT